MKIHVQFYFSQPFEKKTIKSLTEKIIEMQTLPLEILEKIVFSIKIGRSALNFLLCFKDLYDYIFSRPQLLFEFKCLFQRKDEKAILRGEQFCVLSRDIKHGPYSLIKKKLIYNSCFYDTGKICGFNETYHEGTSILKSSCFYTQGEKDGECKSWYTDGTPREFCFYKKGKLYGEKKIWHRNGILKHKSTYINGLMDGFSYSFFDTGKEKTILFYILGKRNGVQITYHRSDGGISEIWTCKNGQKHGLLGSFWPNKNKKKCENYENGRLNGNYEEYFKDGKIAISCSYLKGEKDGCYKQWTQAGKKYIECLYKNGKKDGEYKEWGLYGENKFCSYKDDKLDGKFKSLYPNGNLKESCSYLDGFLHGNYIRLSFRGNEIEKGNYLFGHLCINANATLR